VYTEYVYGENLVGIYGTGVGHTPPVNGPQDLAWFGIAGTFPGNVGGGGGGATPTSVTTSSKPTTTSGSGGGACAALYGQCGGSGYTGPKCCSSGTCKYSNDWYSQCL